MKTFAYVALNHKPHQTLTYAENLTIWKNKTVPWGKNKKIIYIYIYLF